MPSARLVLAPQTQQNQTASLRLQHAVRLLQMSSQDFLQTVNNAAQTNPFLDGDGDDEEGTLPAPLQALVADEPVAAMPEPSPAEDTPDGAAEVRDDADGDDSPSDAGMADDWGTPGSADGSTVSALDLTPASVTLSTHLHGQLNLLNLPPRDAALARAVVELLDEDGYLRCDPVDALAEWDEVAALRYSNDELNIAVRRVQSLDPAGVGARVLCSRCERVPLPAFAFVLCLLLVCPLVRALFSFRPSAPFAALFSRYRLRFLVQDFPDPNAVDRQQRARGPADRRGD